MSKRLVNILYRNDSIDICHPSSGDECSSTDKETSLAMSEVDYQMLLCLEDLILASQETQVISRLLAFYRQLHLEVSMGMRAIMLREFNKFLQRVSKKFTRSHTLYRSCLQVVIEFKNQMDGRQGIMNQEEWIELEKSIYLLSAWENECKILGVESYDRGVETTY